MKLMGILDISGARTMAIQECGEAMERLNPEEFVLDPRYYQMGISDVPEIRLRKGVIERIRAAKNELNKVPGYEGWNFKIWDGFRTYKTQQILYFNYWNELLSAHPDWSNAQLTEATTRFVSKPSHDPLSPAPHSTGGAVDLTLVDEHGREVPMGTEFDEFSDRASIHYFSGDDDTTRVFHANRMTLLKVMEEAGFANYPEEWWHFSYGDQMWAASTGMGHAIYGRVRNAAMGGESCEPVAFSMN